MITFTSIFAIFILFSEIYSIDYFSVIALSITSSLLIEVVVFCRGIFLFGVVKVGRTAQKMNLSLQSCSLDTIKMLLIV